MTTAEKIQRLIDDLETDAKAADSNNEYLLAAQIKATISNLKKLKMCW